MLSFKIGEKKLEKGPNDIYSGYHYRVLHEAKLGSNEITKAEKVQTQINQFSIPLNTSEKQRFCDVFQEIYKRNTGVKWINTFTGLMGNTFTSEIEAQFSKVKI